MTHQRYGAIYADPPWYFRNYSAKGTGRAAIAHYDVMDLDALKAMPVSDMAAKDCALFMWATDPMLPQALELMAAWGFAFKTVAFNWVKLKKGADAKRVKDDPFFTGLGYWTRANPELCLLGTRGKPKRRSKAVRRLVVSERREHSRKPDEIYDRIELLVDGPYLELFARESRGRWDAIGDQVNDPVSRYLRRQPSRIRGEDDIAAPVRTAYAAE